MKWIKCADRLPPNAPDCLHVTYYLAVTKNNGVYSYYYMSYCDGWNCSPDIDGNVNHDMEIDNVVAWMPMPKYEEDK